FDESCKHNKGPQLVHETSFQRGGSLTGHRRCKAVNHSRPELGPGEKGYSATNTSNKERTYTMTNQYGVRYPRDDKIPKLARVPVIIIGGGQAGLAMGRLLKDSRIEFLILEAGRRIGDSWRKRWDSLRLFSPAQHSALPGLSFPGEQSSFPTKDQVA